MSQASIDSGKFTGHEVTCDKSFLSMTKIPGVDYNYSDHEGVTACLQVQASHTGTKQQHMSVVDLHRQILEARAPLPLAKERARPKFCLCRSTTESYPFGKILEIPLQWRI